MCAFVLIFVCFSPCLSADNKTIKKAILIYFFHLLINIFAKLPPFYFFNSSPGSWLPESLMRCRSQSSSVSVPHDSARLPNMAARCPLSNHNNKSPTAQCCNVPWHFLSRKYKRVQQCTVHFFFRQRSSDHPSSGRRTFGSFTAFL